MSLAHDFRYHVVRPILRRMDLHSDAAEVLLCMTAAHESRFDHLVQVRGPALGLYQMEPATHEDIWANYLHYRPTVARKVTTFGARVDTSELIWNLSYATRMARVHYLRDPNPLPAVDNLAGLAAYAKRVWNTGAGAATPDNYLDAYLHFYG